MPCGCNPTESEDFDPDCEGVSQADLDRFGGETHPCPKCKADVYDEAKWCGKCGYVFSEDELGGERSTKTWIIVGAGVLIALFGFFWLF